MKKSIILTTTTALLAVASVAQARHSSDSEFTGYQTCMSEAKAESSGLVPERSYFIEKADNSALYYVNATRWEDGERAQIRIECETKLRGHKLVSSDIRDGRFIRQAGTVRVEVAQN